MSVKPAHNPEVGAMCFPAFIKKIFRTFYLKEWRENADVELLHEQSIDQEDGRFDPDPHCLSVLELDGRIP